MCFVAQASASCTSVALFSCRCWNFASPVSTVFTERSSQSSVKW